MVILNLHAPFFELMWLKRNYILLAENLEVELGYFSKLGRVEQE